MALIFALWRGRAARAAALWIGLTLAVPLILAPHRLGVFGPRSLYLPSVGATLLRASGYLWLKLRHGAGAPALLSVMLLAFGGLTVLELPAWRDELTWTARTLERDPTSRSGRVGSLAPLALHPVCS